MALLEGQKYAYIPIHNYRRHFAHVHAAYHCPLSQRMLFIVVQQVLRASGSSNGSDFEKSSNLAD